MIHYHLHLYIPQYVRLYKMIVLYQVHFKIELLQIPKHFLFVKNLSTKFFLIHLKFFVNPDEIKVYLSQNFIFLEKNQMINLLNQYNLHLIRVLSIIKQTQEKIIQDNFLHLKSKFIIFRFICQVLNHFLIFQKQQVNL